MEAQTEKILYITTYGDENPDKAAFPFVLANAALAMDVEVTIVLQSNAVRLARKGFAETVPAVGGLPPLKKLIDDLVEHGRDYAFRKCYARGCPNNLCPHVSQAVLIANRYLQRDYHKLRAAGIEVEERLFDLADMMVAFDQSPAPGVDIWTLPDLVAAARDGRRVNVALALSFISAVEHFDRRDQPQTYLIGEFDATVDDAPCRCERCFACYPTEGGEADRRKAVEIADARLALLYEEFQQAGIPCPRRYFLEGRGGN